MLFLESNFHYFRKLPSNEKKFFLYRLMVFKSIKRFSGHNDMVVTKEMKQLVAASAIQLTFGLDDYMMIWYRDIKLHPEGYPFRLLNEWARFQGHSDPRNGVVVFSWKHFQDGYLNPDDARNLGLHEMAHALHHHEAEFDSNPHYSQQYEQWLYHAIAEYERIKNGEERFLRDYAATNMDEMLAVCIECFFETPQKFKEANPELYEQTCLLLRQDPLAMQARLA
ncbi:MAG: zinc-dependent peptidase [Chitinophagales bacterium]|nr:zinc-dependent peptidase [Chitinophagales bacterium]